MYVRNLFFLSGNINTLMTPEIYSGNLQMGPTLKLGITELLDS